MLPEKVVSLREEGPSCENGNTAEIVDTGFELGRSEESGECHYDTSSQRRGCEKDRTLSRTP